MKGFEDHFSKQAHQYADYRPGYPVELFSYLAELAPARQLAWDCGTGSGQAARELVRYFERVVATDASSNQLAEAFPHDRIEYRVERAEAVSLDTGSVDLITVAVAVHWFDLEPFYQAVRRVGKKEGILAVWTYHLPEIDSVIDQVLYRYYKEILADYWPERIRYLDERYQTLPFPFEELVLPRFVAQADWDLEQMTGFLESWSATRRYEKEHGKNPVGIIRQELAERWGGPGTQRRIRWPLHMRVGRIVGGENKNKDQR
jgi:SAM-dependent methyltransferase